MKNISRNKKGRPNAGTATQSGSDMARSRGARLVQSMPHFRAVIDEHTRQCPVVPLGTECTGDFSHSFRI